MMTAQQRQWLLILVACVIHGCAAYDNPTPSKPPLTGLIATPVSYYSTPKARVLASKYKDNLDHIIERIVRNSATSQLQFANNISSVGGIGFFTHSAAKTADERYLEVVVGTPETFETKGDYSDKVNRLFALYGRDLLATLAADSQILADRDVAGYGLNLTWRTAQSGTQTNRILMARAILYFGKERVASFLKRQLSPQELLGDAVIFALEEDGPLNLVSFQPRETQPDFRPPIREDNLVSGGSPMITSSAPSQAPVAEKLDPAKEKLEAEAAPTLITQEPISIAAAQNNVLAPVEITTDPHTQGDAAAIGAGNKVSVGLLEKSSGTKDGSVEKSSPASEKKPAGSDTPAAVAAPPPVTAISEAQTENSPVEADQRGPASARVPVESARPGVSAPKSLPEQSLPSSKPIEVTGAEPKTAAKSAREPSKVPIAGSADIPGPAVDKIARSDPSSSRQQSANVTQASAAPAEPVTGGRKLERAGERPAALTPPAREITQPIGSPDRVIPTGEATKRAETAEIRAAGASMNQPEEQKILSRENSAAAPRPEPPIRSKPEELPPVKLAEKLPSSGAVSSSNPPPVDKPGSVAGRGETPAELARAESARAVPAAPQIAPAPQVSAVATPAQASKEATKVPFAGAVSAAPTKSLEPVKSPTANTAAAGDSILRPASNPADAPLPAQETRPVAPSPDQLALLRKPAVPAAVEKPTAVRPAAKSLEGYIIQIAFADKDKAQSWAEKMAQRGYAISVTEAGDGGALRVRLGNFTVRDDAERQLRSFRQDGLNGIIINLPQAFRPEVRSSMP